jgi:hypothetical protein
MALIERRNAEIFGCLSGAEQLAFGDQLDRLIERAQAALDRSRLDVD